MGNHSSTLVSALYVRRRVWVFTSANQMLLNYQSQLSSVIKPRTFRLDNYIFTPTPKHRLSPQPLDTARKRPCRSDHTSHTTPIDCTTYTTDHGIPRTHVGTPQRFPRRCPSPGNFLLPCGQPPSIRKADSCTPSRIPHYQQTRSSTCWPS